MTTKNGAVELIDYCVTQDMLWSGVARIERLSGDLFRFVGYTEEIPEPGKVRWVKAGSLIMPLPAIARVCAMTAAALESGAIAAEVPGERMLM